METGKCVPVAEPGVRLHRGIGGRLPVVKLQECVPAAETEKTASEGRVATAEPVERVPAVAPGALGSIAVPGKRVPAAEWAERVSTVEAEDTEKEGESGDAAGVRVDQRRCHRASPRVPRSR
ncbi:hypothetical protein GCM10027079_04610 [Sediminivirga luteola]|uniref:Uncharacterized protein n=1 Tax=Sediminivirga luteola TaxID=1774748 RepID=A0A8J2TXN9_9MICO|nr:hypothetical protein GCM10011333_13590 [Sediminivirga luteola]